jgi:ribosome-binding factor A
MAEAIREVVSNAILFEVSDPRVKGVTVLHVEVAGDLRTATVFVSIMGTPADQENSMRGLKSATGYLQSLVAARLQTRFTPVLGFKKDEGIKKSVEMSRLIEETLAADRADRGEPSEDEADDPDEPDDDANP